MPLGRRFARTSFIHKRSRGSGSGNDGGAERDRWHGTRLSPVLPALMVAPGRCRQQGDGGGWGLCASPITLARRMFPHVGGQMGTRRLCACCTPSSRSSSGCWQGGGAPFGSAEAAPAHGSCHRKRLLYRAACDKAKQISPSWDSIPSAGRPPRQRSCTHQASRGEPEGRVLPHRCSAPQLRAPS